MEFGGFTSIKYMAEQIRKSGSHRRCISRYFTICISPSFMVNG